MAVIAGAATDERLTPETRIRLQYAPQVVENANVFDWISVVLRVTLVVMRTLPRHAARWLGIMLAFSPPGVAFASSIDPSNALVVVRGAFAESAAPMDDALLRERSASLVIAAMSFVGVPYRPGGSGGDASGFDCSGFTRHVFALGLGLVLPRSADEQATARGLVQVDKADLRPGDLVFFNTLRRTFSHVGIYIGDGRFIHAPKTGSEVRIESMRHAYWAGRYTGARRVASNDAPVAVQTTLPSTTD
jgi:cell wall-associated NlpC family hydrolase